MLTLPPKFHPKAIIDEIGKRTPYYWERWINHYYDRKYKIDTEFIKHTAEYSQNSSLLRHAVRYQASGYSTINNVLAWLKRKFEYRAFVDLGCGAGRACIVASLMGFQKVIGVEIDSDLSLLAEKNVRNCTSGFRAISGVEIVHGSASEYTLPIDQGVIFLFNPFDAYILEGFLDRNSKKLQNGKFVFVYLSPRHGRLLKTNSYDMIHEWKNKDFNRVVRVFSRQPKRSFS